MEFTGKWDTVFSKKLNQKVNILEYVSKTKSIKCFCGVCGQRLIGKMYVVQDIETDGEIMICGADCIKKI